MKIHVAKFALHSGMNQQPIINRFYFGINKLTINSDDGRYIISGSEDRHVYILNANQSQLNAQYGNSGGNNWLKKDKIGYESFEGKYLKSFI